MSVGVVPGEDGETDVTGGTVDASHASTRFAQTKAGTIGAGEVTVREGDGGELAGVNRDVGLAQVVTADEASFVGVPAKSTVIGDLAALVDGDAETTNNLVGAAQAVDAELERLGNDVLNDSALEQAGAFVNDLLGRGTTATDLERLEAHTLATLLNDAGSSVRGRGRGRTDGDGWRLRRGGGVERGRDDEPGDRVGLRRA